MCSCHWLLLSRNKINSIYNNDSLDLEPDSDEDDLLLGLQTPNPVVETPPILPDVEMTPVDQTVTPETSRKKDKQKARVTDDKQVKNQSTTAKPDAQTSAKNSQKEKTCRRY